MSIYVGTSEIKNIYVGTTPAKAVYVGTTKVRPSGWTPGANTIAYYPLTSVTTTSDMSGNGHNMTYQSGGTFGTYQGVDCLSLSYSNSLSCNIAQLPQGNNPITISCWCRIESPSGEKGIFGYGRNATHAIFQFVYTPNRFAIRTYMDDCMISTYDAYKSKWINIVGTSNGSMIRFYINGNQVATASHGQNMQDTTLYIGKGIVNRGMNGYISNAIVENRAWSASDVTDYYNLTKSKYGL